MRTINIVRARDSEQHTAELKTALLGLGATVVLTEEEAANPAATHVQQTLKEAGLSLVYHFACLSSPPNFVSSSCLPISLCLHVVFCVTRATRLGLASIVSEAKVQQISLNPK